MPDGYRVLGLLSQRTVKQETPETRTGIDLRGMGDTHSSTGARLDEASCGRRGIFKPTPAESRR